MVEKFQEFDATAEKNSFIIRTLKQHMYETYMANLPTLFHRTHV